MTLLFVLIGLVAWAAIVVVAVAMCRAAASGDGEREPAAEPRWRRGWRRVKAHRIGPSRLLGRF